MNKPPSIKKPMKYIVMCIDTLANHARMPDMRLKKQRVCQVCSREFEGHMRLCNTCQQRKMRAKYIGDKGCSICGGLVSTKHGMCWECYQGAIRLAGEMLAEKRSQRLANPAMRELGSSLNIPARYRDPTP